MNPYKSVWRIWEDPAIKEKQLGVLVVDGTQASRYPAWSALTSGMSEQFGSVVAPSALSIAEKIVLPTAAAHGKEQSLLLDLFCVHLNVSSLVLCNEKSEHIFMT